MRILNQERLNAKMQSAPGKHCFENMYINIYFQHIFMNEGQTSSKVLLAISTSQHGQIFLARQMSN